MSKSYEDMMLLYSKFDINDKRNEFSSLLEKTNELISEILKMEQILSDTKIKNYDTNKNSNLTEDEIFTFFYEDLWNIKNRLLALLILNSSKEIQ